MTDDLKPHRRAAADLRWLADTWPALAESRIPGTVRRPAGGAELTLEQRDERDQLARVERWERSPLAPGEHAAPVDLDVLQALTDVAWLAEWLAAAVTPAWCPALPPLTSTWADPRPLLDFAAQHLPDADEHIAKEAAEQTREVRDQITAVLALRPDGQLLRIVCPWCGGAWFGRRTWRVRVLPGGHVAIICESGVCAPPLNEAGTWWRGQPAWPLHMWPWLAKQVQAAEMRERMTWCAPSAATKAPTRSTSRALLDGSYPQAPR